MSLQLAVALSLCLGSGPSPTDDHRPVLAELDALGVDVGVRGSGDHVRLERIYTHDAELMRRSLELVGDLSDLDELAIWGNGLTDDHADGLQRLSAVRKLTLVGTKLRKAGIRSLRHLSLEELHLHEPKVRTTDLVGLSGLGKLRSLTLATPKLDDSIFAILQQLTRLEELDLAGRLTPAGLQHLEALPRLRSLFLDSVPGLDDRALDALHQLREIKTLTLLGSGFRPAGLWRFANATPVNQIILYGSNLEAEELVKLMRGKPGLRVLSDRTSGGRP